MEYGSQTGTAPTQPSNDSDPSTVPCVAYSILRSESDYAEIDSTNLDPKTTPCVAYSVHKSSVGAYELDEMADSDDAYAQLTPLSLIPRLLDMHSFVFKSQQKELIHDLDEVGNIAGSGNAY